MPASGKSSLALDCGTEGYRYFPLPKLPASLGDSFGFGLLKKFSVGGANLLTSLPFTNVMGYIRGCPGIRVVCRPCSRWGTPGRQKEGQDFRKLNEIEDISASSKARRSSSVCVGPAELEEAQSGGDQELQDSFRTQRQQVQEDPKEGRTMPDLPRCFP